MTAEPVKPQTDTMKRGLVCPKCGCQHFRVIYTRASWAGRVVRRRECRYCGRRITTTERVSE